MHAHKYWGQGEVGMVEIEPNKVNLSLFVPCPEESLNWLRRFLKHTWFHPISDLISTRKQHVMEVKTR